MAIRFHWLFLALAALASFALAQSSGGDFVLTRTTTDSGGGYASGATFELTGTIAQPDANAQQSSGGDFVLAGGFWANASEMIFSNGFEEN